METKIPGTITVEVGAGELLDKITILKIKNERIDDAEKLRNIRHELDVLQETWVQAGLDSPEVEGLEQDLREVNSKLWEIEDEIRECEAKKDFGERFVELARSVYITNDERARIKKAVNTLCNSAIVEEKSYSDYKG
ncbi:MULTISPECIES: DUF6165 family protein [unclassified Thioalkalivibrio]|uniref:DUF6165 family protein n=1 Tax=unclassified Thioalkalivibrio TaxID=2621013 RepID=UPI00037C3522|nr:MULTISPECIES: DUF6165 family protein [unclassified Thioalkalivibrio]